MNRRKFPSHPQSVLSKTLLSQRQRWSIFRYFRNDALIRIDTFRFVSICFDLFRFVSIRIASNQKSSVNRFKVIFRQWYVWLIFRCRNYNTRDTSNIKRDIDVLSRTAWLNNCYQFLITMSRNRTIYWEHFFKLDHELSAFFSCVLVILIDSSSV